MSIASSTAATNPAGRPNQQRHVRSHSRASDPPVGGTEPVVAGAAPSNVPKAHIEEPEPTASDADIFGEFFEAPKTAETINLPHGGGQSSTYGHSPAVAPMEVEAELNYFLNEPSPPSSLPKEQVSEDRTEYTTENESMRD